MLGSHSWKPFVLTSFVQTKLNHSLKKLFFFNYNFPECSVTTGQAVWDIVGAVDHKWMLWSTTPRMNILWMLMVCKTPLASYTHWWHYGSSLTQRQAHSEAWRLETLVLLFLHIFSSTSSKMEKKHVSFKYLDDVTFGNFSSRWDSNVITIQLHHSCPLQGREATRVNCTEWIRV